jgi:hypothetical protein
MHAPTTPVMNPTMPTPVPQPTGTEQRISVVSDVTTPFTIALDDTTVLCSSADYSATFLKVLIPQIASVTVFDHTNSGAGEPCMAAGQCSDTLNPSVLIDASRPDEDIMLRVVRTRTLTIDYDAKTCAAKLVEELHTAIRGIVFYHERDGALPGPTPSYADCLAM